MRFILGALTGIVFLMAGAVVYTALNPLPPARTSAPEATAQTAATGSVDAPVPSGTLSGAMPEAAAIPVTEIANVRMRNATWESKTFSCPLLSFC